MSDEDLYSFLDQPALAAAAAPENAPHIVDEFNTLLKEARCWPVGYPVKKQSAEYSCRFHYRRTNRSQAENAFHSIVLIYRHHVLKENPTLEETYPFLKEYLSNDPLGLVTYPDNDTHIYKNATKLVAAKQRRAEAKRALAEETLSLAEGTEAAVSATTPVGETQQKKKKKKKKKTPKKVSSDSQPETTSVSASATHADDATLDLTLDDTGVPDEDALTRVKSTFANILAKLQHDLYTLLRANIFKFMDKTCKGVIEAQIAMYEQKHQLKGRDRMVVGKRYAWDQLKNDMYVLCCEMVTPGFYFLPLYTTPRGEGQIVSKWCHVIRTIHTNLVSFAPAWKDLSERDAMKRLHSFLSNKELETIEKELQANHQDQWEKYHKSIREFFQRTTLATAITLINEIDAAKFPHGYDPWKHTPDALKETLYTYDELQKMKSRGNTELASLKSKLSKAESQIAKLRNEAEGRKRGREPNLARETTPRKKPKAKELKESSKRYKELMKRGKHGDLPCSKCAKLGMRQFHDPSTCTAKSREIGLQRQKERKDAQAPSFPPSDNQRKYAKSEYDAKACPHCKREDVRPDLTDHAANKCYRRPGGECDKHGAKSRGQRNRCVRKLLHDERKAKDQGKANKGKTPQKAKRGDSKQPQWL